METVRTEGVSDVDVVRTFMQDVDVVTSVRKMDSVEDYLELLELFYTDGERKSVLLSELYQKRDIEKYTIEVHGLKSAAANIGAERISGMARKHEEAGKSGKLEWIADNAADLEENYQMLLSEIRRVLKLWQYGIFATINVADLVALDEQELRVRLQNALSSLEDFDSKGAVREVEELLGCRLPEETRAELEKTRSFLKVYKDDEAENLLRNLIG